MPVIPQRIAERENTPTGAGVTIVVLRVLGSGERAEIRELISSGNGDANNHWFQIDPAGGGGGFAITQINGIVNNTFDRTDLDAFAEPTDEIELIVGGANANPGDIAIMGVIYT